MEILDILSVVEALYLKYGLPIIFFTSLIEITPFGWMIPGGTLLALGGYFAFGRPYYLFGVIIFGWLGAFTTFIASYLLGAGAAKKFDFRIKQNKRAKQAKLLLVNHGPVMLTTSMMSGITRFWMAFAAGTLKYKFSKFLLYSGIASLSWTSLMVVVGYLAGSERERLEASVAGLGILSWLFFAIIALVMYLKIRKEFKELQDDNSGD